MPGGMVWKRQLVVHHDRDADLVAGGDQLGDVGLERRVPALVAGHLGVADPDDRGVRRGVEPQHHALTGPAARHPDRGLVPGVADVVPAGGPHEHVVVARGDRHGLRGGQRGTVPALAPTGARRVEAEVPQAVQGLALAARGVLGTKHRCSPLIAGDASAQRPVDPLRTRDHGTTSGCHDLSRSLPSRRGRAPGADDLRRGQGLRRRPVDRLPGVLPARPRQRRDGGTHPAGRRGDGVPGEPAGPGAAHGQDVAARARGLRRDQPVLLRDHPRGRAGGERRPTTRCSWRTCTSRRWWSARRSNVRCLWSRGWCWARRACRTRRSA